MFQCTCFTNNKLTFWNSCEKIIAHICLHEARGEVARNQNCLKNLKINPYSRIFRENMRFFCGLYDKGWLLAGVGGGGQSEHCLEKTI